MTRMLASVRDRDEAQIALSAGADWIDIKEPNAGALGAASPEVLRAIVQLVAGRRLVSATIGDVWDEPAAIAPAIRSIAQTGIDYVKVGLRAREVSATTCQFIADGVQIGCSVIVVCMAEDPPTAKDIDALAATGVAGLMLDTANKNGGGLTQIIEQAQLRAFVKRTQAHGLLCGLAGRLGVEDIAPLAALAADYLGFRGALCDNGARAGKLSAAAIQDVRQRLNQALDKTTQLVSEVT